jgi:hypothetical protein
VKWITIAVTVPLVCISVQAQADEAAVNFAKLFKDVCIAKSSNLDEIEDWAEDQHLAPITNPQALAVFAGRPNVDGTMRSFAGGGVPGSGKAWAVKDSAGHFVLATRLDPESCVVWAQKAEPADVETAYSKMVESAAMAGAEVNLAEDKKVEVPNGQVHIRVHRLWSGSALSSVALVMATVNRSGGPFQAMLETQRLVQRNDPINPMVPLQPPANQ